MGIFGDEDVKQILKMIEPEVFTEEEEEEEEDEEEGEEEEEDEEEKEEDEEEEAREKEDEEKEEEETAEGEKEDLEEGLLQMKLPESVKLQVSWFFLFFQPPSLWAGSGGAGVRTLTQGSRELWRA